MANRLTRRRAMTLLIVAQEFLAGHDGDTAEACGAADDGEGDRFMVDLGEAMAWLSNRIGAGERKDA